MQNVRVYIFQTFSNGAWEQVHCEMLRLTPVIYQSFPRQPLPCPTSVAYKHERRQAIA